MIVVGAAKDAGRVVLGHVGHEHAERGKHAGVPRHDHRRDVEALGDLARVHAAGAAEREQRKVARIVAALTDTTRIARSMLAFATRTTPSASSLDVELQTRATSVAACARASTSSIMRPPRNYSGSRRPSNRFASVTVSSVPVP